MATDIHVYVDDVRITAPTKELAWLASSRVAKQCSWLGLQDAARKRREPSQVPGSWAGAVILTNGPPRKSVTQEKWEKAQWKIRWIASKLDLEIEPWLKDMVEEDELKGHVPAGEIQPLQAIALPNNGSAAQDMNLIISAFTIAQIFAPLGCGVILAALVSTNDHGDADLGSDDGSEGAASSAGSGQAYRTIFVLAAVLQVIALPLLMLVKERKEAAVLVEAEQRQREYTARLLSMSGRSRTTLARPRKGSLALLQSVEVDFDRADIAQLTDRLPADTPHVFQPPAQLSSSAGRVD